MERYFPVSFHDKFSKLCFRTKSSISVGFHTYLHRFVPYNLCCVFLHQGLFLLPYFFIIGRWMPCLSASLLGAHALIPRIFKYVMVHGKRDFADRIRYRPWEREIFLDYPGGHNQSTETLKSRELSLTGVIKYGRRNMAGRTWAR